MAKPNKNTNKPAAADKTTDIEPTHVVEDLDVVVEDLDVVVEKPVAAEEVIAEEPTTPVTPAVHAPVEDEPRWPLDVWHQVSQSKIGQPSHVLVAAMAGSDPAAQYSEPEVRRLVEKFLNTPAR